MKTKDQFNEKKSIVLIKEMIDVSSKHIKKDGLLLLVWGCIIVLSTFMNFFPEVKLISRRLMQAFNIMEVLLGAGGILFTIYYIYQNRKRTKTYIGITARYTWIGILVVNNLIIIMIHQKTGEVDFELNHPIQMCLIGLALFITGGLYREKLLLLGGIMYWIAAYFAKDYALHYQLIFECSAAFLGFIIPGYYLYIQSCKRNV
ncbi:MAG: hypothetical protein PF541_00090 [Prolixibacteraceae bacterium]|nr:hypothetical protein [Prolixibacteraceae bacterium]